MMKKRRAMSLIEMLIVMVILFFVMGSLFWMVILGQTSWQSSVNQAGERQDTYTNLWRIAQELSDSNTGTITDHTLGTPYGFSFLSAFDQNGKFVTDDQGLPVWQKYEIYYISGDKLLNRDVYGSYTKPLTQPQLLGYMDGTGKLLAEGAKAFTLTINPNNTADINLTIDTINRNGKQDRQVISVTSAIRN